MLVKICGLRDEAAALAAVEASADLLGFVFAPSRRQVDPDAARAIIAAVRRASGGERVRTVGVFVNETLSVVEQAVAYCGLDYVQLHGDEDVAYIRRLPVPAIVARAAVSGLDPTALAPYAEAAAFLLLDAAVPGQRGGSGRICDWPAAAAVAARYPVLLAGGLTPANVATAIVATRPRGVDVSSGVETGGRKDVAKVAAFVRQVRLAAGWPSRASLAEHPTLGGD